MPNIPRHNQTKKKKKAVCKPTTPEEFLDAAVEQEEHGDRWIDSGDIPKALRFYQKADSYYKNAASQIPSYGRGMNLTNPNPLSSTFIEDVSYNFARLVFAVYSKVVSTGEIDSLDPNTVGVPLDGSGVVLLSIGEVLQVFESTMSAVEQSAGHESIPLDLLFTYAQVLTESGEEMENLDKLFKALSVYEHVFVKQLEALNDLKELENENSTNNEQVNIDSNSTINISSANGTSPSAFVDTIHGLLECINITLELNRDEATAAIPQNEVFDKCIEKYRMALHGWFSILKDFFFECPNTEIFQMMKIGATLVQETNIAFTQVISTLCQSVDQMVELWSSISIYPFANPQSEVALLINALFATSGNTSFGLGSAVIIIPNSPDRNMAAGDAFYGFAERAGVSEDVKWAAYSKALVFFKQGWTISLDPSTAGVDQTLQVLTQNISIPNLPALFLDLPATSPILKLKLLIARGDTDLLRSTLNTPSAQASLAVLRKNAENMYVSASNLQLVVPASSSASGETGVRLVGNSPEAQRLKLEVKIKLYLLRGTPEERQKIFASSKYRFILKGIKDLGGMGLL